MIDLCPRAIGDGIDALPISNEEVPRILARDDDVSIGLLIGILPANRRDTQGESYSGRCGNRPPEEESNFSTLVIVSDPY